MHNPYGRQSFSFISGVALLLAGLDSTSAESRMKKKNRSTTSEPGQYLGGVNHITSLRKKPFSSFFLIHFSFFFSKLFTFSFFFFIFVTMHNTYSLHRRKRDPDLLRADEVVPSEK